MILCYRCFEEDVFRPGLVVLHVVTLSFSIIALITMYTGNLCSSNDCNHPTNVWHIPGTELETNQGKTKEGQ